MTYRVLINGHAQSSKGFYLVYLLIYTVTVVGPLFQIWSSLPSYLPSRNTLRIKRFRNNLRDSLRSIAQRLALLDIVSWEIDI